MFKRPVASDQRDLEDYIDRVLRNAKMLAGIELAVRCCGLTNMLDRPVVADLGEKLGFPDAARWIEPHPRDYVEERDHLAWLFTRLLVLARAGAPTPPASPGAPAATSASN